MSPNDPSVSLGTAAPEPVSPERVRALLDYSWDILSLLDREGRLIYNSPAAQRIHGFEPEEMEGRNTFEFFHPDDAPTVAELFRRCLEAPGQAVRAEYRYARKGGTWIWMEAVAVNMLDDSAVQAIVVNSRDISERKEQELALQESERFADQILDTLTANLAVLDAEGRILKVNRAWVAFAEANGHTAGHPWVGTSYLEVCEHAAGQDRPTALAMSEGIRGVLTGSLPAFELEYPCHSPGKSRWFQAQVSRFQGRGAARLVVAHLDITHLREEESRRLELERMLQQSQKMESLGSLAGGVAHDMNNVLASVLGLASMQQEQLPPGTPAHDAFALITKACLRGGGLVRRLLEFARKDLAEIRDVDLNILIQEEMQLLQRTTLGLVELVADLEPNLPLIQGDAGALVHAVMNLCLNAVDAMPTGGVLTLRTRVLPGNQVELTVADTGPGMTDEVRSRALDPFFTTKPVGKGTGLGLSIVYSTVQAHHGTLDLDSAPGAGTTVRLRFPVPNGAALPGLAPRGVSPSGPATSMVVYLVDDDPLIRETFGPMLQFLGHRATLLASGEALLEGLERGGEPQVVILDLHMPGIGGREALLRLRRLRPTLPVILATGREDQVARELAAQQPRVSILAKPFRLEDLRQHLAAFAPERP